MNSEARILKLSAFFSSNLRKRIVANLRRNSELLGVIADVAIEGVEIQICANPKCPVKLFFSRITARTCSVSCRIQEHRLRKQG